VDQLPHTPPDQLDAALGRLRDVLSKLPVPDEIGRAAGVIRSSAHQALQELREVISVLRDDPSEDPPERPQPTIADLGSLVEESRTAGTRVELTIDIGGTELPASTGRTVYRIVQEGLSNARKHADAGRIDLTLDYADTAVCLEVRDDGAAVPVAATATGFGLVGLRERAEHVGGRLSAGAAADRGWVLRIEVPA
jgi:signal transduction histidine kinase